MRLLSRARPALFSLALLAAPAMAADPDPADWPAVLEEARGQTVYWYAWGGAPSINAYISWVGDEVEARHGISLVHVKVTEIGEVISRILAEKGAGRSTGGGVDLMWINGENFAAMKRQNLLLATPWADRLPNYALADIANKPVLTRDFTTPVDGLESPWGTAQLTFYADSVQVPAPPAGIGALAGWIAANPGRFTYAAPPNFIGTTFLKQALHGLIEDPGALDAPADTQTFEALSAPLWAFLDKIHPGLWRSGRVFASDTTHLKTLLADSEIDIAMTFNPGEASAAINDGLLPQSVRSFVFDNGMIGNAHFVAAPFNANAKAGAMVVANFLLSPEAQARKADESIWGDPTVLDLNALSDNQRALFEALERGPATLPPGELGSTLNEPDPSWTIALEAEWARRYGG